MHGSKSKRETFIHGVGDCAKIPVHVVSQDREFEPARVDAQHVDIVVDERNTVRVLPGFDGVTLRRVLDVLRAQEAR